MKPIRVVITDLDDTLWDWVDMWYRSFAPMLNVIVEMSGLPRDQLIEEFHVIHQNHGTSEYSFSIGELPSLIAKHPGEDLSQVYAPAIKAFREGRESAMSLYPTVLDTLKELQRRGVLIVGYTESMSFYTQYRVRKLAIDPYLDYLYSPIDHDLPANISAGDLRRYAPEHYRLSRTVQRFTPPGKIKPAPEVLSSILCDLGVQPEDCIYVGDKLCKDVKMAKAASVTAVWAQYGEAHKREEYELLKRVTHWTPQQVREEQEARKEAVNPDISLRFSFSEVLQHFTFAPFRKPEKEELQRAIEVWKKAVEVQQHFNDIEMRIRNLTITLELAVLGAAGLALKEKLSIPLFGLDVPFATMLLLAGLLALVPLWLMDRHWYHHLLLGAVRQGEEIEREYECHQPGLSLARSIRRESPWKFWRWTLDSSAKVNWFYGWIAIIMFLALLTCTLMGERRKPVSPSPDAARIADAVTNSTTQITKAIEGQAKTTGDAQRDCAKTFATAATQMAEQLARKGSIPGAATEPSRLP